MHMQTGECIGPDGARRSYVWKVRECDWISVGSTETEVDETQTTRILFTQHEVRRLHVAMNDTMRVNVFDHI